MVVTDEAGESDVVATVLAHAFRAPEDCALVEGAETVTYGELVARVEELAAVLRRHGLGPGELVAVCLRRGIRAVLAILAVLRTGAAYVPLDTGSPPARLAAMLADCDPRVVLVERTTAGLVGARAAVCDVDDLPDVPAGAAVPGDASPEDPAYVIFTSGSTGRPKGVLVPRRSLNFFCASAALRYGLAPGDRVLQFASLGFDASVDEILLPLSVGATVVFRDEEMVSRPDLFLRRCGEWGITVIGPPTAYWHEILAALERGDAELPSSIRLVIIGGEAVHAGAVRRWRERVGAGVRLLNCYGPTETTVVALTADLADWDGGDPVPIGDPLPGVVAEIRSPTGEEASTGELWLGGPGIATGYLGRPELTAERFVRREGTGRYYRTGDVVTRLSDGRLGYLRRLDQQVQVGGVRVEIGEVEAALRSLAGVRDAVVLADRSGATTTLTAHLLHHRDEPDEVEVRAALADLLPAAMVPRALHFHPSFPRNEHGKVDVAALREIQRTPAAAGPDGPVRALWCELLGRTHIERDDDIVALGADSLTAVRMLARLRSEYGVELTLTELYAAGTLREIEARVAAAAPHAAGAVDASPTAADVTGPDELTDPAEATELTGLQQDYWISEQLCPDLPAYTLGVRYRLTRPIDRATLTRALEGLVRRHPALGARFPEHEGRPRMVVNGTGVIPLTDDPAPDRMDLAAGPVARAVLGGDGTSLTILAHHLVFDGWSAGVLAHDLGELLAAPKDPADVPVGVLPCYAGPPDAAARAADVAYWRERFAGAAPAPELPADRPRPANRTFAAIRVERELDPAMVERWREFGRAHRASLFMVLLAGVHGLLARYTGRTDVTVLAPVANRPTPDLETAIGGLLNTLPLRGDLSADPTFEDLIYRVRDRTLADLDHQRLPLPEIIAELGLPATPGRNPFGGVLLTVHNAPLPQEGPVRYAGEVAAPALMVDAAIGLDFPETGPRLSVTASTELFDSERIGGLLDHLLVLLDAGVAAPHTPLARLPLLPSAERRRLLHGEGGATSRAPRFPAVHRYLEDVAARTPHAPALVADGITLDYAALDAGADRLARHLRSRRPAGPVAIALPRGADLFVAIWAVLKAGCAYVPLDPAHPRERLRHLLTDSGATLLITRSDVHGVPRDGVPAVLLDEERAAIAAQPDGRLDVEPDPSDPAYLIYTSGSTGLPKGVVVTHGNLTHAVEMWQEYYRLRPEWTYQQVAGVSFDMFVGETLRAHCTGGRLLVVPREIALDPPALLGLMQREHVACTELVPSILRPLLALGRPLDGVALLIGGGEEWPVPEYRRARELVGPAGRVVNSYGVTEATVDNVAFEGTVGPEETRLPIGRPFPNQRAYVLDAAGEPLPAGITGELYLGGAGVARGYHARPELTRKRFLADPFVPGGRMYRTGDAARLRRDGMIEYLGRLDDQVKVHGHRVELGEVEAALRAVPGVHDAAAALHDGDLVGYVVPVGGPAAAPLPSEARLREVLSHRLPAGSVPARVLTLTALPLTPHGKLDRPALPAPERATSAASDPPATPTEHRIAAIWAELLGVDVSVIGVGDAFASLGGDSFAAVRMARAVSDGLSLVEVYQHPTLRELAAHLDGTAEPAQAGPFGAADPGRVLHRLTPGPADPARGGVTVVAVPFAGGSAASFVPLAEALPESWSLLAVELPRHDRSRSDEVLRPIDEVADRVVGELADVDGPVLIYGQCVGTALALQIAHRAPLNGVQVVGVGLGALFPIARLPGRFFDRFYRWLPTDRLLGDRGYLDYLRARGGFVDVAPGDDAEFVLRNVRHDTREAEEFFTADAAPGRGLVLDVPLLSVVGEQDRITELHHERYREWEVFSPHVELVVLPRAGHFFVKHQACELAGLLVDAAGRWGAAAEDRSGRPPAAGGQAGSEPAGVEPPDVSAGGVEPSLRRFAVVAAGQIASMIGSGISTLVMGIWIFAQTRDLTMFGLVSAIGLLPGVVATPWAGAVADRFDRRRVMIVGNALSALSMGSLALLVSVGGMRWWHVAVALTLTSVAGACQRPAYLAAVAQLVPKRFLGHAAGISQLGMNLGQVAGPLLGAGLLAVVDIGGVLLIEACGFLLGVVSLLAVRFPDRAFKPRDESFGTEIVRGWRYVMRRPGLRSGLWFFVVDHAIYTVGLTLITPLLLIEHSALLLGAVLSAGGIGGLVGSVTMSLWGGTRRRTNGMIVAMGAGGLALAVVGLGGSPATAAVGMFVLLFTEAVIDGSWIAVLQAKVETSLLGRVMSIFTVLPLVTVPIGYLVVLPATDTLTGPLGQWIGTEQGGALALLVGGSGLLLAVWAVRGWFHPRLRFVEYELPDALPGAEIPDRDALQREADSRL
ncbi:non-ribosomal peptide synthetase/MFS transporter [Actinomadura geliboluensis]|uniref:non-ribosomal peptide synthetase/MFS transporter n=1 Tax=Actinomadura geliboluensis TaxID=882440 RepID=UPI0014861529|nr:non-ribosomal peptide synthetase/MFS transporter [Actinomadura geliboluensis]